MVLRPIAGLLAIVTLTITVLAAQMPHREFVWDPDTCCCHHAGPCPCPGHQLPAHEKHPCLHRCGSGGTEVVSPSAPSLEMAPTLALVAPLAHVAAPIALATPHAPPQFEPPSAPS